jgi:hypothetical protein
MNRNQRDRLDAIEEALPSAEQITAALARWAERRALRRIAARTATPSDFAVHWAAPASRRWLLKKAGQARYRLTRGLPLPDDLWTAAALVASWPLDEAPPQHLYEQIKEAAGKTDPAEGHRDHWELANGLLAALGAEEGLELRREYYAHLGSYDPQWRALTPRSGLPEHMAARVQDGTADVRDHFFTHLPHLGLYLNELLVMAVGHRLARQRGEAIYLTEPRLLAAELLSYFPGETPPTGLWETIESGGDRRPTAATIEAWREFNRCRAIVGRWDHGKRARQHLAENWELYEAEYRYLQQRGELP